MIYSFCKKAAFVLITCLYIQSKCIGQRDVVLWIPLNILQPRNTRHALVSQ